MSSDLPDGFLGSGGDREDDASERAADDETYHRVTVIEIGDHRLAIPVGSILAILDPPTTYTRIPRTPPAITGVTDIRGQITVLVDPHVHFPDSGGSSSNQSLLVLDRPDQPAAIDVDAVHGVEVVPEDALVDADGYDAEEIAGTALAHPLIVGAVQIERTKRDSIVDAYAAEPTDAVEGHTERSGLTELLTEQSEEIDQDGVRVSEFSLEDEAEPDDAFGAGEDSVEIEVIPLLDIDRLLLASGPLGEIDTDRESADEPGDGAESDVESAPDALSTESADPAIESKSGSSEPVESESDDDTESADADRTENGGPPETGEAIVDESTIDGESTADGPSKSPDLDVSNVSAGYGADGDSHSEVDEMSGDEPVDVYSDYTGAITGASGSDVDPLNEIEPSDGESGHEVEPDDDDSVGEAEPDNELGSDTGTDTDEPDSV
ncbi:chemotaxis protein CheW [Halovivax gelatinilyticus]|uniref:chemotaxis protein CheW n=1 Tax=Halovivax gelatinilyticus TaxID=2961597 RepID=UPI0020CA7E13|nr:chemotaxis protein CheW [Halovivax gelatinilyticus]